MKDLEHLFFILRPPVSPFCPDMRTGLKFDVKFTFVPVFITFVICRKGIPPHTADHTINVGGDGFRRPEQAARQGEYNAPPDSFLRQSADGGSYPPTCPPDGG